MNDPKLSPAMDLLLDVPLQITVELGRRKLTVAEVLQLGQGSTVELSKAAGDPLDIYVNDRLVARGEAVMVGERYGVRIVSVESQADRAPEPLVTSPQSSDLSRGDTPRGDMPQEDS